MTYIDPVQVSSKNYKTVLENAQVRVLEMNLSAGETDVTHSHPSEIAYFVSGGKVKIHLPGGDAMEADIPDGHVMWHEEWTHQVENVGTSDIKAIVVELKQ
ncbi:MAG: hypothetical protein O2783_03490 [Chloroflexi bacterium]|nr:hypothetical protein [Chloroflexota bacterium]